MARGLKGAFEKIAVGDDSSKAGLFREDQSPRLIEIPLGNIERDPNQPRTDLGDLEDLKASIRIHGVLQHILVTPIGEERYMLLAGERRFTAAKELGIQALYCVVRTIEEVNRLEAQLIENTHRKDLNPVEEAKTYKRLMDEFNYSQRQLAERLGKSVAGINQTLRILSLPEPILEGVQTSEHLTKSVLLEIAKQGNEAEQLAAYEQAKSGGYTVQSARQSKTKTAVNKAELPPRSKVSFATKTAAVTLIFERAEVSPQEVVEALSDALKHAKRQAKIEAIDKGLESGEETGPEAAAI